MKVSPWPHLKWSGRGGTRKFCGFGHSEIKNPVSRVGNPLSPCNIVLEGSWWGWYHRKEYQRCCRVYTYDPSIPEAEAEACCKLKVSLVVRRGPRNWLGILGAATLKAELLGMSLVFWTGMLAGNSASNLSPTWRNVRWDWNPSPDTNPFWPTAWTSRFSCW